LGEVDCRPIVVGVLEAKKDPLTPIGMLCEKTEELREAVLERCVCKEVIVESELDS
jgi:hypothetical protein